MTNQTNIDYLFAHVAARGQARRRPTSPSGRRPPFDDHLVNASASASSSIKVRRARTRSGEGSILNTADTAYRSHSSDQRAATNEEPSESSAPTDSTANDADAATVDDPQDSAQPTAVLGADEESSGDVLPGEDENNSEPVAAEEARGRGVDR